jgi:hypothetical protein
MRDPVGSRAHTDPELHGYRSQALPPTYRPNQLAAALFKRRFLESPIGDPQTPRL